MTFQSLKGASEFGHFCLYSLNFQLSQWLFLAIFDDNLPKPRFLYDFSKPQWRQSIWTLLFVPSGLTIVTMAVFGCFWR